MSYYQVLSYFSDNDSNNGPRGLEENGRAKSWGQEASRVQAGFHAANCAAIFFVAVMLFTVSLAGMSNRKDGLLAVYKALYVYLQFHQSVQ